MRRIFEVSAAIATMVVCTPASAQTDNFSPEIRLGTGLSLSEGAGLEASFILSPSLTLRTAWYGFDHADQERIGSIDFDLDLAFQNTGGYLDFRPARDSLPALRVTAGLLLNYDKLNGEGIPSNGYYRFGSYRVPAEAVGELSASARYSRLQPYLGLGYDFQLNKNLYLSTDAGVIFQGSPSVKYDITGPIRNAPDFEAVIAKEKQKAEDELEDYSHRPVVKASLHYSF